LGPKKGTSPEPTDAPEATTTELEGFGGGGGDEGPPDAACHSGLAFGDLGGRGEVEAMAVMG
jgi:hypothetical protein